MISDEERREVAAKLRELGGYVFCPENTYELLADALGVEDFKGTDELFARLADLIEPSVRCLHYMHPCRRSDAGGDPIAATRCWRWRTMQSGKQSARSLPVSTEASQLWARTTFEKSPTGSAPRSVCQTSARAPHRSRAGREGIAAGRAPRTAPAERQRLR